MTTKHASTNPKVHPAPSCGMLLWSGASADAAEAIQQAGLEARARSFEEYRRLLYVGLTRARERLYVVGHRIGRLGKDCLPSDPPKKPVTEWHWHALVMQAMRESAAVIELPSPEPERLPILRWPPSREPDAPETDEKPPRMIPAPQLILHPLRSEAAREVLRPSRAGAVFRASERGTESAVRARRMRHGVLLHRLFQHLPKVTEAERSRLGYLIVREAFPHMPDSEIEALVAPVLAALNGPALSPFLAEGSRSEVGIAGPVRLTNGVIHPVSGRIDRIRISETRVDILDFKTGLRPDQGPPDSILRQMALYQVLARAVFGHELIRCHLYWTAGQHLETLRDDLLTATFAAITSA